MELIDCLMKTGFTRQESMLYVTLCKEGELNGYEAAKILGISRSNAYLALAGLVDKGGAHIIESDSTKYAPVSPEELTNNLSRHFKEILEFIKENTPGREISGEPYITVSGKQHIIDKMTNIIMQAKERIYISLSPSELAYITDEIKEARDRGLKVVVITSKDFLMDGITIYHSEKKPGQVRLISDSSHVLTGELSVTGTPSCVYSKNRNLVGLIKDSLTNEIKLIQTNGG